MNVNARDLFLSPHCQPTTADLFVVRQAILRVLQERLVDFYGIVLDVGCGDKPYRPLLLAPSSRVRCYVGLDIRNSIYHAPDLYWDGARMPLPDSVIDCALATEVLEHCQSPELLLRETQRVLKEGGFLFFTVPFLWPLHDVPYDYYRYTPFSLERHLRNAGFGEIHLQALGGWDACLAQMMGLWVRRRPMSYAARRWLSRLATLVIRFLARKDRPPLAFTESTMITGLAGVAIKTLGGGI